MVKDSTNDQGLVRAQQMLEEFSGQDLAKSQWLVEDSTAGAGYAAARLDGCVLMKIQGMAKDSADKGEMERISC